MGANRCSGLEGKGVYFLLCGRFVYFCCLVFVFLAVWRVLFFCCLGGWRVVVSAVWAGGVFFFAVWAMDGNSLTCRSAWLVFKAQQNKKNHGFPVLRRDVARC